QPVLRADLYGGIDFSPDSRRLALGEKGSIRLYDLVSGKEEKRLASTPGGHEFAFDPSGRRLAVTRQSQANIRIYDLASGTILLTLACPATAGALSWRPDGEFLATTCADNDLCVWNVRTGKEQAILRGHEALPTYVAFNHRGDLLASSSWDQTLRLWDP